MITKTAILLSILNIGLLASLLYVYVGNYRKLSSQFSLGLIIFASILIIENILAAYFSYTMMGLYAEKVASQALILRGIETLSLVVLAVITWKN